MNTVDHLEAALAHLQRAKRSLSTALDEAPARQALTLEELVGVLPQLNDLGVELRGAIRTAKELDRP